MDNLSKDLNGTPNKVVDLLVSEIFRKNGVNINNVKKNVTDEQKTAIKELVEELKMQVDAFVRSNDDKK